MQEHVDDMVSRRVCAEQLVVDGVRDEAERNPVSLLQGSKRPGDGPPSQPLADVAAVDNIGVVVCVKKGTVANGEINDDRSGENDSAQNGGARPGFSFEETLIDLFLYPCLHSGNRHRPPAARSIYDRNLVIPAGLRDDSNRRDQVAGWATA